MVDQPPYSMSRYRSRLGAQVFFLLLLLLCRQLAVAAETNVAVIPPPAAVTTEEFKRLEDQLNNTVQKAENEARLQSETAARQNSVLSERLIVLEKTLLDQRQQEIEAVRSANHFGFLALAISAGSALLAIFVTMWFQFRCLNRFLENSAHVQPFPMTEANLLEQRSSTSGTRLLGAIEVLERRIRQLEQNGSPRENPATRDLPNTESNPALPPDEPGSKQSVAYKGPHRSAEIALLLGKGQTLLELEKPQESLVCFEEAIAIDPDHAEAYLKKAVALERLKIMDQSLTAYDRALKLNPQLTIAYLYKGRVLQELQRYNEALLCYEKALNRNALTDAATSTVTA